MFTDPLGDLRLVIHSCFGARVNSPWALALSQAFREAMGRPGALGPRPEVMVSDDGILFRFLETDQEPPLDLIREMGPAEARERLLVELPNSAVFGAQFRMNAARALLLPAAKGAQKRTPFWLQRLRAKDLLSVAKGFEDFPIVAETYRDCLRDVLDLAHLEEVLRGIQGGEIEVVINETMVPSPVAGSLLYDMIAKYMYEWDQPKAERQMQALMVGRELLSQLLDDASARARCPTCCVRRRCATWTPACSTWPTAAGPARPRNWPPSFWPWVTCRPRRRPPAATAMARPGSRTWQPRAASLPLDLAGDRRYVLPEQADAYRAAFGPASPEGMVSDESRRAILRRVLSTHGPLTRGWLLARYPWPPEWLDAALEALVENGEVVTGQITPRDPSGPQIAGTVANEAEAVRARIPGPQNIATAATWSASTARHWHCCAKRSSRCPSMPTPISWPAGSTSIPPSGCPGPGHWSACCSRCAACQPQGSSGSGTCCPCAWRPLTPGELEDLCGQGDVVWVGSGGKDPRRARVRFLFRGEGNLFLPAEPDEPDLSPPAAQVLAFLRSEGACFFADLEAGTDLSSNELERGPGRAGHG